MSLRKYHCIVIIIVIVATLQSVYPPVVTAAFSVSPSHYELVVKGGCASLSIVNCGHVVQ